MQGDELREIAAIQRKIVDRVAFDQRSQPAFGRFDQRRLSSHFNGFADSAQRQLEVDDGLPVDCQRDAAPNLRLETFFARSDTVITQPERGRRIPARLVRLYFARDPCLFIEDDDFHTRHDGPAGIRNGSGNRGCRPLCVSIYAGQKKNHQPEHPHS